MHFLAGILLLVWSPGLAESRLPDPLFHSSEILRVTISGPLDELMDNRDSGEEYPGSFDYPDGDGATRTLNVKLTARGKFRRKREVCRFPPLRINFVKSEVRDTLFHGQDKVKLVTHCKSHSRQHTQYLVREYLAYRALNRLTEQSFRVRLLEVTYVDTKAKRRPYTDYAFLIEHKDRLGKRIGAEPFDTDRTVIAKIEPAHLNLTSVFQYLIMNTDFSPIASADEESCCHNYTLFGAEREHYVSIPYDFDMSGWVNAEYAQPNPRFGIRRVTDRLYRGRCVNEEFLPETLAAFREARTDIESLVSDEALLDNRGRRALLREIREFYKTIEDPALVSSKMNDRCI